VFVLFMEAKELTSPTEIVGYIADQECAFAIPVLELNTRKLGLWMPYIFINSSLGMVTGREVWGFQKEIATFSFPAAGDPSAKFVANAMIFDPLAQSTQGKLAPLVTVAKPGLFGAPTPKSSRREDAFGEILDAISKGTGALLAHLTQEVVDVANLLDGSSVTAINFKQFRDAVDPTRACYQAIVESPMRLDVLSGFGLLGGGYRLSITPCQSHTIAKDLGLAAEVDVAAAFFVDMGFSALAGKVVWQAT
jgi:hypothetical protein